MGEKSPLLFSPWPFCLHKKPVDDVGPIDAHPKCHPVSRIHHRFLREAACRPSVVRPSEISPRHFSSRTLRWRSHPYTRLLHGAAAIPPSSRVQLVGIYCPIPGLSTLRGPGLAHRIMATNAHEPKRPRDRQRPALRSPTSHRAWPLLVAQAIAIACLTVLPAAIATPSDGPGNDDGSNATRPDDCHDCHGGGLADSDAHSSDSSSQAKTIIFLFGTIAGGALLRQLFKNTGVPYTVSLMVVGLTIGMCSNVSPDVHE